MNHNRKPSTLIDDPVVRELIFGLAHVGLAPRSTGSGVSGLHAVVLRLAETTTPDQYRSWLSDGAANKAMTVDRPEPSAAECIDETCA